MFARRMIFLGAIEGSPHRLADKQSHGLDVIRFVAGESMVTSLRQGHEIALFDVDADPFVVLVANVEISTPIKNVSDFFRVVDVFLKEGFDFFVVTRQQIGFDGNNVGVRVSACVYVYV